MRLRRLNNIIQYYNALQYCLLECSIVSSGAVDQIRVGAGCPYQAWRPFTGKAVPHVHGLGSFADAAVSR